MCGTRTGTPAGPAPGRPPHPPIRPLPTSPPAHLGPQALQRRVNGRWLFVDRECQQHQPPQHHVPPGGHHWVRVLGHKPARALWRCSQLTEAAACTCVLVHRCTAVRAPACCRPRYPPSPAAQRQHLAVFSAARRPCGPTTHLTITVPTAMACAAASIHSSPDDASASSDGRARLAPAPDTAASALSLPTWLSQPARGQQGVQALVEAGARGFAPTMLLGAHACGCGQACPAGFPPTRVQRTPTCRVCEAVLWQLQQQEPNHPNGQPRHTGRCQSLAKEQRCEEGDL